MSSLPKSAFCVALSVAFASPARAGLRPLYGGDLVVCSAQAAQTTQPWKAWNPVELALLDATTLPLSALGLRAGATPGEWVLDVPRDLAWGDGTPLSAKVLVDALQLAARDAAVALPPLSIRVDKEQLVIAPTVSVPKLALFAGPWLRLARGGAFRAGTMVADPAALGGRAFTDHLRGDVRDGRKLEVPENAVQLCRDAPGGRFVFALPRPSAAASPAIAAALAGLDRASLARLFLRGFGRVPDGWPLPAPDAKAAPAPGTLTIALDESERDVKTIADRLQVLLRDRKMPAKVVAEPREASFARLAAGEYDVALVALPTAPTWVQAATLARLALGEKGAQAVWQDAAKAQGGVPEDDNARPLRDVAARLGAVLLYQEGGGISKGARVRLPSPQNPWELDLGAAWLVPGGAPSP